MKIRYVFLVFVVLLVVGLIQADVIMQGRYGTSVVNLDDEKNVVLKEGETLSIDGNEYNAKAGSEFVFDESGGLVEGTRFVTKENVFNLNGFEVPLPEDSIVTYEKDKIVIELKEDVEVDVKGEGKGLLEFKSSGVIELEGVKFESFLDREVSVFFDGDKGLFYIKLAKVNDFEVGRLNAVESYLFFDEIPDGVLDKPAMLVKNGMVVLRSSSVEESLDLIYGRDGAKFVTQALKNGEVAVNFGDDRLDVVAKGSYYFVNGELIEYNGVIKILSEKQKGVFEPTSDGIPLHGINHDESGNVRGLETFYNIDGKDFFIGRNKGDGIYEREDGEVYVDNRKLRVKMDLLDSEEDEKFRGLDDEVQLSVLRAVANGGDLEEVLGRIATSYRDKVNTKIYGSTEFRSALQDIKAHQGQIRWDSGDDLGHETVHGINAYLRNEYGRGTGTDNAFYLLNGEFVVLEEPNIKISDVNSFLPSQLKSGFFASTYTYGSMKSWNNEPLYILDELTSYTNGGIVSLQTNGRLSMNMPEFMSYSIALGLATEREDSSYYQSSKGEEFKNFLRYSLERAMDVHVKQTIRRGGTEQTAKQSFHGMTTPAQQDYLERTLGSLWTNEVWGF